MFNEEVMAGKRKISAQNFLADQKRFPELRWKARDGMLFQFRRERDAHNLHLTLKKKIDIIFNDPKTNCHSLVTREVFFKLITEWESYEWSTFVKLFREEKA